MSLQQSPFKFLDAYQQEDHDIFFGRDAETEALYEALSGVKQLLVYGPSGAGKTSLVECGLRNQFSDADWFALTVRRGSNAVASVYTSINEALENPIPLDETTQLPKDKDKGFGQAIEDLFSERYQPIYLLFDQFEELLLLGDEEEKRDFFTRLDKLIRYKVPCRVLLIMREEFIGHLSEYEPLCPSLFQHRFRLEKMGRSGVKQIIERTLAAPQFQDAFTVDDPEALATAVLDRLPDRQREIELTHVQVFLSELWDRARTASTEEQRPHLTRHLVQSDDNLEAVLDSFLKKQLNDLEPTYGPKAPLETLAAMISERYTKLQLSEEEIKKDLTAKGVAFPQLNRLLADLEEGRLIRALKAGDRPRYEISHDVLAKVVGQNLTEEMQLREKAREIYRVYGEREGLLAQQDLDYLRPFQQYFALPAALKERMEDSEQALAQEKEAELAATRRRLRVVRGLLAVAVLGLLAAGYFYWDANEQRAEAEVAKKETQQALGKANTLIDAFYFYAGRFALAYGEKDGNEAFYFIDKNGNEVKKLGRWQKAEQFDDSGFAKVVNRGTNYLLDTIGHTYHVAYRLEDLNADVSALDLRDIELNAFPKEALAHPQLQVLLLEGNLFHQNNFRTLPSAIQRLSSLHVLYLRDCQIRSLPPEIGQLTSLTALDLESNDLTSLPPEIGQLTSLTTLDLESNDLTSLPPEITQLTNLSKLILDGNDLTSLPSEIG